MMKKFLVIVLVMGVVSCKESGNEKAQTIESETTWQLVFKNDKEGNTIFGDKAELLEAARNGVPIRIGWGGKLRRDSTKTLEHYGEGMFTTILNGKELFVQLPQIVGQRPYFESDSLRIRFRETNRWTRMAGTNGYALGLMVDIVTDSTLSNGLDRRAETSWYTRK